MKVNFTVEDLPARAVAVRTTRDLPTREAALRALFRASTSTTAVRDLLRPSLSQAELDAFEADIDTLDRLALCIGDLLEASL